MSQIYASSNSKEAEALEASAVQAGLSSAEGDTDFPPWDWWQCAPSTPSCSLSRGGRPAHVGHPLWVPHCPLPNSHCVTHRTTHTWSTWRPPLRPDDGGWLRSGRGSASKMHSATVARGSWGLRASGKTFSLSLWTKSLGHLLNERSKGRGQVPGLGTGLRISLPAAGAGEIASACREKGHVYGRSYSAISQKQTQRMGRAHVVGEVGKWSRTSAEGWEGRAGTLRSLQRYPSMPLETHPPCPDKLCTPPQQTCGAHGCRTPYSVSRASLEPHRGSSSGQVRRLRPRRNSDLPGGAEPKRERLSRELGRLFTPQLGFIFLQ